jgi:hypothetical protein
VSTPRVALLVLAVAGTAASVWVIHARGRRPADVVLHSGQAVDVSRAKLPQSEVSVAVDPANASLVLAGSNEIGATAMRVYASSTGGGRWTTGYLPQPSGTRLCEASDPSVAIAADGQQYFAFLGIRCLGRQFRSSSIYISTRRSASGRWQTSRLPVSRGERTTIADDRPSLTVDSSSESAHRGRLYVAWSRFNFDVSSIWADPDAQQVDAVDVEALVSHSDDHGRTWSRRTVLSREGMPLEVRTAVARNGTVYATWRDAATNSIWLARAAHDGSTFEAPRFVAAAVVMHDHSCHTFRARIPAQRRRCVSPNPVVTVDDSTGARSGTVYIVWGSTALNRSQDVDIAAFTSDLRPILGVEHVQQVGPPEGFRGRDQFLPTAAVDSSDGRLWSCYYETAAPSSARARFTCTASDDGGRSWLTPVAPARVWSNESMRPANVDNGYGDYEAVAAARGRAIAAWTDGRLLPSLREEIYASRINARPGEETR